MHRSFSLGWQTRPSRIRCNSSASGSNALQKKVQGLNGLTKAALTSGSLSLLGDVCAQLLQQRKKIGNGLGDLDINVSRMARMFTFGLFFYGPFQHKWYGALDGRWPSSGGWPNFLSKVTLNQLVLGPIVTAVVFSWNLALLGQSQKIKDKVSRDLCPTMINGWKFWVPAASINFAVVPLNFQVLYMSMCSVLWTAYLSHSSNSGPRLRTA